MEKFQRIHSQLSIVGYSDKWLWEEAALGTGGENICCPLDRTHVLSSLMYAQSCSMVSGRRMWRGDFVNFYDADGKLQYLKELDPQIHSSGPAFKCHLLGSDTG